MGAGEGVGDWRLGWGADRGFILGWGRWPRIPSLWEACQRGRVCGCALGGSAPIRGITPQSALAANWRGGGQQLWRGQNCGELFQQGLQEWLLKRRHSQQQVLDPEELQRNQCPGAVDLPQEGCILGRTFQAGSMPKTGWNKLFMEKGSLEFSRFLPAFHFLLSLFE